MLVLIRASAHPADGFIFAESFIYKEGCRSRDSLRYTSQFYDRSTMLIKLMQQSLLQLQVPHL